MGSFGAFPQDETARVVLPAPVSVDNPANTYANLTGLSFPVLAGEKWWFKFFLQFTTAAATTGAAFSVNGPALTLLTYRARWGSNTPTAPYQVDVVAYDTPAAVPLGNANITGNVCELEGFIECSAADTVIGRFMTEIGGSAITVLAGSFLLVRRVK